jgi:mono/diheme cytochrome c family protein
LRRIYINKAKSMNRPLKLRHLMILSISMLLVSACSFSLAEELTPPPGSLQQSAPETKPVLTVAGPLYPLVPPDPVQGEATYIEKCAPCHGANGMGNGPQASQLPVPAAAIGSAEIARASIPADWYTLLQQGNLERRMPPFPSLSDRQKWDVIAYVYTLSTSSDVITQGEDLYAEFCASCHGLQGIGDGEASSQLASDPIDFTDQSYMAAKSSAEMFSVISDGAGTDMPAFADELSDMERWAVADYLRTLMFTQANEIAEATVTTQEVEAGETPAVVTESTEITQTTMVDITVQLVNGSGGDVPSDLEVMLYGFDNMQMAYTQTLQGGENGSYLFADVELVEGRAYLAAVDYQGSTYGSDVAVVEDASQMLTLPVVIYETMTDTSVLTTDRIHIFFDFVEEGSVQVSELFIISNPTDRAVVSEEEGGPVVLFSLPEGATNLEFQDGSMGERFIPTVDGFADTLRVAPGFGEYQVLFAFELPYDRSLDFIQQIGLSANALVILLPDIGVRVKSDSIQDEGTQDVQGTPYLMYSGDGLSAGSTLTLNLSGRPKLGGATLTASDSQSNLIIGIGGLGLALIIAGIWLYVRSRRELDEAAVLDAEFTEEDELDTGSAMQDSETVMDAIITLDDMYQSGDLPEEAYLQRRLELKARLKELLEKEGTQDGGA